MTSDFQVYSVSFGRDGTLVSGSEDKTVRVWNSATGEWSTLAEQTDWVSIHPVAYF